MMLPIEAGTGTLAQKRASPFWRDHMGAGVNAIRTQTLIRAADHHASFASESEFRQWNARL